MAHMPTSTQPSSLGTSGLVVEYTATGSEGVSFMVPIGQTVNVATYKILYSPQGVTSVPFVDLPQAGGDRTTTEFRCNTVAQMSAGEKLVFVLFGA